VEDRLVVEHLGRQHRADDVRGDAALDLVELHLRRVLCRDHDGVNPHRLRVTVLHGHLALAVGSQPGELGGAPAHRQPGGETMRQHDRQRHELRGLATGEAEHESLSPAPPVSTPMAMSGDWGSMHESTAQVEASKPYAGSS
jgi:hypothetical protein